MQKALLIAEKSSMMKAIEEAYAHYKHKKYDITFVAASGHLLELYEPGEYEDNWKKWDKNVLPMVPQQFKIRPSKEGYEQYKKIRNLIKSGDYDYVINAGDPGREGELIITEIIEHSGCKIPELRLWPEDLTIDGICKAFDNMKMPQDNLKRAAKLRAIDDWLIGINSTRAVSLAVGSKINVGRVMTAILTMIVKKDDEVSRYTCENFYNCAINIKSKNGSFTGMLLREKNATSFESQEEIQELIKTACIEGIVSNVSKKREKQTAPLLHDLTELQKEAYSEFGFSPEYVLQITQSLYMNKFISYPRTDCEYLSSNVAAELTDNLMSLALIPAFNGFVSDIMCDICLTEKMTKKGNKWVDDSKITDHHAIIPTKVTPDFSKMNDDELKIYILIARRLLAIFLPERIVEKTKVICNFGGISTISKGYKEIQKGFAEIIPKKMSNKELPELENYENLEIEGAEIIEKEKAAPTHYNYKTLMEAMKCAGSRVEDKDLSQVLEKTKGIGTASTRASIISKLEKLKYIELKGDGRNTHLEATELGRNIYELLKETDLTSVVLTAKMEHDLQMVERGDCDYSHLYNDMVSRVFKLTKQLKDLENTTGYEFKITANEEDSKMKCPCCGRTLIITNRDYKCPGKSDETCDFSRLRKYFGAEITQEDMMKLLNGEKIVKKFTWKNGKSNKAGLYLGTEWYEFEFARG